MSEGRHKMFFLPVFCIYVLFIAYSFVQKTVFFMLMYNFILLIAVLFLMFASVFKVI
ncbi:hypothetical protein QR305_03813 [Bacteroides finegoldii]|uniref:Uncharacterized protein n=1 Tax=Bacteroides finegoldii CL09T03C10 TaxID=997888 RepID=K5CIB8_9BACE|nr:hypothetical protein HMPREF1057_03042 [Bacteroides finegoldii CL09T03C10]